MMHTRCPACTTTFRFTPEQAKARHGKVRCGRCQHVFDAIEYLVDAVSIAAPAPPEPVAPPAVSKPLVTVVEPPLPPSIDTPSVPGEIDSPTAPSDDKPAAKGARTPNKSDGDSAAVSPLSAAYLRDVEKARVIRWPWLLACVLAALALALQCALVWRIDLATRYPQLREPLTQLCIPFECEVGLPSNAALLKIESSDLHPLTQKKGQFELVGTLHNYAPYTQVWPHLELTLTDGADRPIVRKVLAPEIYLGNPQTVTAGFPAQGEFAVQVQLDAGQLPAAGYRLYLFYP